MSQIVPPPWELTGNGLVLVYRFPRALALPWIPDALRDSYVGGIGAVMCVDYHTSNAGPYRELLFIPGMFSIGGQRRYSITQIYVSTKTSVVSGRANWAIPKQQAAFFVGRGMQHVSVAREHPLFSIDCEAVGPHLPANTAWLPIQPALVQNDQRGVFITRPGGRGALQRLRVWRVFADGVHFPDLSQVRPLMAFAARGFTLIFPQPTLLEV